MIRTQSLHDLPRGKIDYGQPVANIFCDVQIVSPARYCQACRISRSDLVRLVLAENDLALEFCCTVFPGIAEYRVVVAAGDAEFLSVARECDTVASGG